MPLVQGTTSREASPERQQTRLVISNDGNDAFSNRILTRILGQVGTALFLLNFKGFNLETNNVVVCRTLAVS